ncbi:MAG: transcriptional repressor [Oscillospiraceae bacterium]|nr:transcriptional repressor [Oscillospiraceae bacterium]
MDNKRNTIQRRLIFDALKELNIHATAEQVYEHVAAGHPSISKATVYRNLGQMSESGEIINIGSFYGSAHYDHRCHDHYHFICEKCKRVFDINSYFPEICSHITNADGFEIKSHNLSFSGLCRECKRKRDD